MSQNHVKKTINIDQNTAQKLKQAAKSQDRSESSVIRESLKTYFKEQK